MRALGTVDTRTSSFCASLRGPRRCNTTDDDDDDGDDDDGDDDDTHKHTFTPAGCLFSPWPAVKSMFRSTSRMDEV